MANGSHGSLERVPGALFRAMGVLVLQKKDCAREALAYELKEHLETLGVDYHVRTLKRQLTGSVSSVPPEVQGVMRHVLLRANGLRTDVDIDRALRTAGLWVAPENRQPERLSSERIVPLAQLWLLFNPTHSKRRLAMLLSKRLARQGVHLKVDPLQSILSGRQPLARREVHEALLALLSAALVLIRDWRATGALGCDSEYRSFFLIKVENSGPTVGRGFRIPPISIPFKSHHQFMILHRTSVRFTAMGGAA